MGNRLIFINAKGRDNFCEYKGKKILSTPDRDTIKEVMTKSVFTLDPQKRTIDALEAMVAKDIGAVPILENGQIVGIITALSLGLVVFSIIL